MEDFSDETEITEENILSLLTSEAGAYALSPTDRMIARNDLVVRNELDYVMIVEYREKTILFHNGDFYLIPDYEESSDLTLPAAMESNDELRDWRAVTSSDLYPDTTEEILGEKGGKQYLRLLPNTTFSFTLYVFMAKTDEELDPEINGETLSLFASLTVEEEQQGGNS